MMMKMSKRAKFNKPNNIVVTQLRFVYMKKSYYAIVYWNSLILLAIWIWKIKIKTKNHSANPLFILFFCNSFHFHVTLLCLLEALLTNTAKQVCNGKRTLEDLRCCCLTSSMNWNEDETFLLRSLLLFLRVPYCLCATLMANQFEGRGWKTNSN